MNYRYLEAFIAVGDYLNFTNAAKDLHITQAAVSRQIKLLEESLGVQLLIRSPQKVVLTEHGKSLYNRSVIFNDWIVDFKKSKNTYKLKIGTYQGFLEKKLVHILSKYYKNENVEIDIVIMHPGEEEKLLESRKVDITIGGKNIQNDVISSLKLMKEEIVIFSKNEINIKKIEEYPWILCNSKDYLVNYSKKQSKKKILAPTGNSQIEFVVSGMGIGMLPRYLLPKNKGLKFYQVKKYSNEYLYATTLNFTLIPDYISHFLRLLKKEIKGSI